MNDNFADELMAVSLWLEAARRACRSEPQPSKRTSVRYAWDEPMELKDGRGVHYVRSRDISASGVGLVSRRDPGAGETVYVRREEDDPWVSCRVAHATETVGAYRVGVEWRLDG